MKINSDKLIIRPTWSVQKRNTLILSAVALLALLFFLTYFIAYQRGSTHGGDNAFLLAELKKNISVFKSENKLLKKQVARLEGSDSINQSAYKALESAYERVDQKNEFLNRRVNFYRSIISPKDGVSGLRLHAFKLLRGVGKSSINFEMTLIQAIRHTSNANVEVSVGLYDSEDSAEPLAVWKPGFSSYSFRYSEVIFGNLSLDSDVVKGKFVKVVVIPDNDHEKKLVEWHKV